MRDEELPRLNEDNHTPQARRRAVMMFAGMGLVLVALAAAVMAGLRENELASVGTPRGTALESDAGPVVPEPAGAPAEPG